MVVRLRQCRLVAVVEGIEALREWQWLAALRQGLREAPQVVWLSDGARGLWRICFDEARHRLRHGNAEGVLADLAEALAGEGLPATTRETLTTILAYVARHRDHINYEA